MAGPLRVLLAALALMLAALPPARAQLQIGLAAPLTGSDAVFGLQVRAGVEQAIADMNAFGGLLGQQLSVAPGDDLGDAQRGADVAKQFIKSKVSFVVGPFSSAVAMPVSTVYGAAGVVEILPAATAPQITDRGIATLFRLCGRDDQQSAVAAQYLLQHHETQIAILHDRTTAGKSLADGVRKLLADAGVKDVLYASLNKGDRDVAPLVARLKTVGARIVFWGGTQPEAGLLVHQIHEAGLPIVLMGGTGLASDDFANLAGPGAEGTLMVFPSEPRQRPEAADLLKKITARGIEPAPYVFYGYAALQVLQQAAEAARSLEPTAVAATMHSGRTFRTVLGPIGFDAKGDATPADYTVLTWRKGPTGRLGF